MPNINKNIIKQAGAAVANATNKAAGLSASTPEPGSIISAIQLVNGGRKIGPEALLHFTESVRNKLSSLLVTMEPTQDLHGYDHPWPAGGGVNKIGIPDGVDFTLRGVRFYTDAGSLYMDGTSAGEISSASAAFKTNFSFTLQPGYYYFSRLSYNRPVYLISDSGTLATNSGTFTITEPTVVWVGFYIYNAVFDNQQCPIIATLSSAPSEYSPFSNICPISGRTGLHVYAGPTSAIGGAATYSMDWTSPAGTVYAGSADIVTGDIKAAPYYASYNGETLVGPWVSSMDVYDPDGTPTTGAQVVDLGGAMTEYHITGQDIITLVGDNYIWSDSGDVTITE